MKLYPLLFLAVFAIGIASAQVYIVNDVNFYLDNNAYIKVLAPQTSTNITIYNTADSPASTLQLYINGTALRFTANTNKTLSNISYDNVRGVVNYTGNGTDGYLNISAGMDLTQTFYNLKVDGTINQTIESDASGWVIFNYTGWSQNQHDFKILKAIPTYMPPFPTNLANITGNFYVNHSWTAGGGNVTESYNVSVNGSWYNGTTSTYYNNSGLSPHGWSNISVYSFNSSGTGSLNTTFVPQNTQVPNNVPVQAGIGNKTVDENQTMSFIVSATDADGDAITFGTNAPKGDFNTTTGSFTWTPTFGESGSYVWYFNSSDMYSGVNSETITVTVTNIPLTITSISPASDPTTIEGTSQSFNVTLNRSATVTWYMNGTSVQTNTSISSAIYTNLTAGVGIYNVTAIIFEAFDTVSTMWNWTVSPVPTYIPSTPVILTAATGNFWVNTAWTAGSGNFTDSYNVSKNGVWTNGSLLSPINTTYTAHGWQNLTIYAWNSSGTGTLSSTALTNNTRIPNNAISISNVLASYSINEGETLYLDANYSDLDSDIGTFSDNSTHWNVDPTTGVVSWSTGFTDAGIYSWQIQVTDGYGSISTATFTVTVTDVPLQFTPPVPILGTVTTGNFWVNTSWQAGSGYDTNSYNVSKNGAWTNGSLMSPINATYTPHGWQNLTIYSWNSSGTGTLSTTALTNNTRIPNNAINISNISSSYSINEGEILSIDADYADLDSDIGAFSDNASQWDVDLSTGVVSWSTGFTDAGIYNWQIQVSDGYGSTSTATFTVTVIDVPLQFTPPVPTIGTVTTGNFWVNTSWKAGIGYETNSYNVSKNDVWTNGSFTSPINTTYTAHGWQNLTIYAWNSSGTGTLSTTVLTNNTRIPNNAINISNISSSYSINEGETLSINANYSDADSDTGTFSDNSTQWNVDPSTGVVSWVTGFTDSGIYNWQIQVTDGYGSTSTATFTVTVTDVPQNFIPPIPEISTVTTGNFWVNTSWQAGSGNDTNSYNVSKNGAWTNGSLTSPINTTYTPHGWQNLTIYAWNSSETGTLSTTALTNNTQIPNNAISIRNVSSSYSINEGETLYLDANYSDLDSDTGTFSDNSTHWNVDPATGVVSWVTGFTDAGIYSWQIQVSDGYGSISTATFTVIVTDVPLQFTPPVPILGTVTTGNFWVNYTWTSGAGNVTDSHNVSMNGNWVNDTILFRNITVAAHGWSNISVYAYNNSGTGTLNETPASANTQVANNAPVLAPIGNKDVTAGSLLTFTLSVTDADSDPLINATNASKGSFTPATGVYAWTPSSGDVGTYHWEFNTSDSYGATVSETITVMVNAVPNHNPVQQPIGNKYVDENQTLSFKIITTDPDGDLITFGTNAAKGSLNPTTGEFTWTPTFGDAGVYIWYFNSNDGRGGFASETITLTVINIPLTITSRSPTSDLTTILGTGQSFIINLNRSANVIWYINGISVQANNSVTWASYTNLTAGVGVHNITASVSDAYDTASSMWNWTVSAVPTYMPPSPENLASTTGNFYVNTTWQAGSSGNTSESYNVTVNGAWTNGTANTYTNSTLSAHSWQNVSVYAFNSSGTGTLNTTPAMRNTRIPNNIPVQEPIGSKNVNENQTLSFTISTKDADGDTITYGTNATKGSLNTATGVFSWTPTFGESGSYVWSFNSTDNYSAVASETITVTVTNIPLTITSRSPVSDPMTTLGAGQSFSVTLNRTVNVTWYINGTSVQTNTSITSASYTNLIAGTGIYNVTVLIRDAYDTTSTMWNWTVTAVPTYMPPSPINIASTTGIFYVNTTWQAGSSGNATDSYNVTVNGSWTNGTVNTYANSTLSAHSWQNVSVYSWNSSGGTGTLNTTPAMRNTRIPNNIPVQQPIGSKNVNENQTLSFTISTTDADGDTITYGTNATKGSLNTGTGVFNWTPTFGESGSYVWSFNSTDNYSAVASETITVTVTNIPLTITSRSPVSDPTTTLGAGQSFSVTLNRTVNVTWYINGTSVQTNTSITSASYTNLTAGVGVHNITAIVSDAFDIVSTKWNWTVIAVQSYMPPSPVNIASTTGNFYVNTTWQAGPGNVTTSYHVSVNGAWTNGSTNTFANSTLSAHAWQNVSVYAFNSSGTGTLNTTPAMRNTRIPNNIPVQQPIGSKNVNENQALSFTISTTDADGDIITYGTNATKGSLNTATGTFTWTPSFGDAGVYFWYFNSSDGYGKAATETITVTVTNIPLTITSRSPLTDPITIQDTAVTFTVNLNMNANVTWYFNGTSVQANNSVTSASYTNFIAGAGVHNITAIISDAFDTVSTMWNWTVTEKAPDITPPLLIVEQPMNGQTFVVNTTTVSGTASDASGIVNVTVNGILANGTTEWSKIITLTPGTNNITVVASDNAGNTASITITVTYTPPAVIDITAPLLIVSQPINNQNFAINSTTLSGIATDASGIYSVTINGNPVAFSSTGSFNTIVSLTNGTNIITIAATDASPNANTATNTITVTYTPPEVADTTAPILIVNQPINNQNFSTNSIIVSGFAADASEIYSVTVNGVPATIIGNSFSFGLKLNAGTNFIEIEAIDSSSNHNRVTVNRTVIYSPPVVLDTTPPELFVNQPVSGQNFITNSITVSGTASQNNRMSGTALDSIGIESVSVNGAIIALSAGPFSTNVYLTPGTNTISVLATDNAGNAASVTRTVTYTPPVVADTTPPLLNVYQPANGQNFITDSITVSGTAYDDSGVYSVYINGYAVLVSSTGSFSSTVYLFNGINNITVSATDASTNANMATLTRTITYTPPPVADTTPPLLILDQRNDQILETSAITVSGKAIDDSGIRSVTVNGVPVYLTLDGRFGVSVDLNPGSNTIIVQAIDSSSNLNTNITTLTVTRIIPADIEPPALIVTFPTEGLVIGSVSNTIELSGSVSDNTGIDSVTVNGIPAALVDESFNALLPLTTGPNIITIIVTDNSTRHNSKTITRNITYFVPIASPGPESNIALFSTPPVLVADGRHMANIIAHVTDSNGIDVVDGRDVTFVTTNGIFYPSKAEVGILPGNTELTAKTRNGSAKIVLVSSTTPGVALVSAHANIVSASLDVAFMASSRLKSKIGDTTLLLVHSPVIVAYNSSIELNGRVGSIRTSTELSMGMVNGTFVSYSIGTATIDAIITNPVVNGDQTLFTIESLLLNNSPISSNLTGGAVKSDVDVGINTASTLNGMKFEMSLHKDIADELKARGGTEANLNSVIMNIESALGIKDVSNNIAFITAAKLDGANAQDILEVPISMTVSGDWYNNRAASQINNVVLVEIYTNGSIGQIQPPEKYTYDSVNDRYTFVFRMKGVSIFALIGTKIVPPTPTLPPTSTPPLPSLPPSGGGGGGIISPEPFSNIESFEIMDEYLAANVPASYIFTSPYLEISEVLITPSDNFGTTSVRVELLKDVSQIPGVTLPLGIVYKYYNIWVGAKQLESGEGIVDAFIGFKVDKSWLAENNLEEGSVSLLGWDGSTWITLETAPKSLDEQFVYYVAKTNAFLPFAIVANSPYPSATVKAGKTPASINMPLPKIIESKFFMWLYIIIGLILISFVVYRVRKIKKSKTVHGKSTLHEEAKIIPEKADTWYNKGFDLYAQGKYEEAIKAYDKAIDLLHKSDKGKKD